MSRAAWAAIAGAFIVIAIDLGNIYIWPGHPVPPDIRDALKDIIIALVKGAVTGVLIYGFVTFARAGVP
jgi:hypothetical protein